MGGNTSGKRPNKENKSNKIEKLIAVINEIQKKRSRTQTIQFPGVSFQNQREAYVNIFYTEQ